MYAIRWIAHGGIGDIFLLTYLLTAVSRYSLSSMQGCYGYGDSNGISMGMRWTHVYGGCDGLMGILWRFFIDVRFNRNALNIG